RGVARLAGDHLAVDLAVEVLLDGGDAGFQALRRHIVEQDVVARQRADVRDPVAHLAGADDTDSANSGHAVRLTPIKYPPYLTVPRTREGASRVLRNCTTRNELMPRCGGVAPASQALSRRSERSVPFSGLPAKSGGLLRMVAQPDGEGNAAQ